MAKKAKPGTGLSAAQHYLGLVKNAQGNWVRPGAALATKTMTAVAQNMGYQQYNMEARTPIANRRGERIGFWDQAAGSFDLAGGKGKGKGTPASPGGKGSRKRGKLGEHLGSMEGVTKESITSTSETGTTGFAHQYSKSPYRTSQFGIGGGKMEFGKSGTGKKKPKGRATRPKPRKPKNKKK